MHLALSPAALASFPPILGSWPTNRPVSEGSVLLTNAPGVPIKPMPWSIVAGARTGAPSGYESVEQAITALSALTAGNVGAAAVIHQDGRYVGYSLLHGFGFDDDPTVHLGAPGERPGGAGWEWRNDAVAALVDGPVVERFGAGGFPAPTD